MKNEFHLVHVGINCDAPEEALSLAELLSGMLNLNFRHGNSSEFAGEYFECTRTRGRGTNGHIAMGTPDLEAAVEELQEKGFEFEMPSATYNAEGKMTNIYLKGEFGGFAIHILRR